MIELVFGHIGVALIPSITGILRIFCGLLDGNGEEVFEVSFKLILSQEPRLVMFFDFKIQVCALEPIRATPLECKASFGSVRIGRKDAPPSRESEFILPAEGKWELNEHDVSRKVVD